MNIKMIPTLILKFFIRTTFLLFKVFFKINNKKVTFASYRSKKIDGNLLYIYEEMNQSYPELEFHFLFKKYRKNLLGKFDYALHMIEASYHLATSKYFIIDDFYFPIYVIKPRKDMNIIQLWHAAGAFKKFGYSTIGRSFGPSENYLKHIKVHSNYSKVYVSAKSVIPYYAEAFDMPTNQIFPLGVPRTDFFFNNEKKEQSLQKLYGIYPELRNKKIILYAPTFRGSSHNQKQFVNPIDIDLLKDNLDEKYVLFIHLHPYMKNEKGHEEYDEKFVYHVAGQLSIEELLVASDLLITDYSSIIFDYSLLNKPMAFFATDLDEYIEERGFYFDYKKIIPGPFFSETTPLINWINQMNFDFQKTLKFKQHFFGEIDGNTSKKIVEHIVSDSQEQ